MSAPTLRDATAADIAAIHRIYAHHVRHGVGTFEEEPPTPEEMAARFERIAARYPWLVAEVDGAVAGYAYGSSFNDRSGYRFYVEDSVYIAEESRGRGLGRLLLGALIERCAAAGFHQMLARVGGAWENPASMRLHLSLGFVEVGCLREAGFKFGRWLDVGMLQRKL